MSARRMVVCYKCNRGLKENENIGHCCVCKAVLARMCCTHTTRAACCNNAMELHEDGNVTRWHHVIAMSINLMLCSNTT